MAILTLDQFKNFFKYYAEEDHQIEAIEKLYSGLSKTVCAVYLDEESEWILKYRSTPEKATAKPTAKPAAKPAPKPKWPITKKQMGAIMNCSESSLPDYLMDDFARCVKLYDMDLKSTAYFLGQCAHESAGLKYPVEIHSGSNYEWRNDLGNIYPGDGVKFAGTGWIQVTGRYNHQAFSDFLQKKGEFDPKIMEIGKTHSSEKYPWSISGHWWYNNKMNEYCSGNPRVDRVGQRVNGRYLPNGYSDRRYYSRRAFAELGLQYPGD